jgi:hypothetical protein
MYLNLALNMNHDDVVQDDINIIRTRRYREQVNITYIFLYILSSVF